MYRDAFPALDHYLTEFVQPHLAIHNVTKEPLTIVGADSYSVGSGLGIVEATEAS